MDTLLVADDLTGACDAAVHFAMRGLRTVVRLPGHAHLLGACVLACTTETRDAAEPEIRAALLDLAAEFPTPLRLFKKIDSTLRGNVGMEIVAARDAFHCDAAVVCSAFPALHRVIDNGILHAPHLARIDVAQQLRTQAGEPCTHVRPADLAAALDTDARLISVDARTDADLHAMAVVLLTTKRTLWAGSAGLAAALARTLGPTQPTPPRTPASDPVLFCIGSNHPVTVAQQDALRPSPRHHLIRIPRDCATIRDILPEWRPAALVLSGGDTASLVLRALGADAIELHSEIVPGVPLGTLSGGLFDRLPVVTKSGGFGDRDTLVAVANFFHAPI